MGPLRILVCLLPHRLRVFANSLVEYVQGARLRRSIVNDQVSVNLNFGNQAVNMKGAAIHQKLVDVGKRRIAIDG